MTPIHFGIPASIASQMTGIGWTDFSGNGWGGCTEILPVKAARSGCSICYAKTFCGTRLNITWGPGAPRHRFASYHTRMRRLNRLAARTGFRFAVFSNSLSDWLDPEVDHTWREEMITTVEECDHLNFLLLTHRPHLAERLLPASWRQSPPTNVWPGVTVDHHLHGFRWRKHLDFWGHTGRSWISAEPLASSLALELDLSEAAVTIYGGASGVDDPSWAFDPQWITDHLDRYGPAKLYFKQWGDFDMAGQRIGKKAAGRTLQGRLYDFTPWPLHRELLGQAAKARPAMEPACVRRELASTG